MFKNLAKEKGKPTPSKKHQPVIIPRGDHIISRSMISHNALKVLYRLNSAGYKAYLVGGCVRDLLLDKRPKDFDIATNALPEEIRKLFRNCRLIGKRFRLAHIVFGKEIIEVATFRTHHEAGKEGHGQHGHQGMIIRDNVYGAIEDDVWRRDFTINSLYYNIDDFSIIDYAGGMPDLKANMLRIIGDPNQRFHEDPVRLLRAVRFMGKLGINISPETEKPLYELNHLLRHVSPARLFQEVLKFFQEGATLNTYKLMQKYNLFAELFPQTSDAIKKHPETAELLESALHNTDARLHSGKTVSPAFLFAVFLWQPIYMHAKKSHEEGLPPHVAYERALRHVLRQQIETLTIPRRLVINVQEICFLQYRLTCRYGHAPYKLLEHPRFRAAYDLLLLRAATSEPIDELSNWWIQFHNGTPEQREALMKAVSSTNTKKKRRRRKAKTKTE